MLRSFAFVCGLAATAAVCVSNASAQCTPGGTGGAIPAAGTGGGGSFSTTLPPSPLVGTLAVTYPGGGAVVSAIKFNGVSHTWSGDTQWVLTAPDGSRHNILCGMPSDWGADFAGDYTLVDPAQGCSGVPSFAWTSDPVPTGTYLQDFGGYADGASSVFNTPIEQIPAMTGTYTLTVYDWVGADVGALTTWEVCFGAPTPPPSGGPNYSCVGTGAGGGYGTGVDGTWPTTMPASPLISPLAVAVPAGATKIEAVKIFGLNHAWYDDTQIVLQDPAGNLYNVLQSNDGVFGGTCGDFVSGDYVFVDAVNGVDQCGNPAGAPPACTGTIPAGIYLQTYGAWPSGSSSINNTNLNSISLAGANGTWNLLFYDWYTAVDNGTVTGWELCFDTVSVTTGNCQILPTVSQTCQSSTGFSGSPSATAGSGFTTTFNGLNAVSNGVVFYGANGPISVTWSAQSNLCVKAPLTRLGGVTGASGLTGGTIGNCDGQYSLDMNAVLLADGVPQSASVVMQAWVRDPASVKTTQLSDSLNFIVGP